MINAEQKAHIIVIGNEKGGSGKSTVAMHIAIGLLRLGYKVGTIDLDSHHKIANMGLKTLIYQNGQEIHKVQYNYSEKRAAQRLTDIFERISNVEERISELGHAMKYDRLSLPETLNQIQAGLDDDSFVEAQLMIPTLEKISTDPHLMHLAQSRALEILQRVRQNK